MTTIARFDVDLGTWSQIGKLNVGNSLQNVAFDGSYFLVVGGHGKKKTEKCSLSRSNAAYQMKCELLEPILDNYSYYPEVYMVDQNYGE